MKVFGDATGGAYDDDILAALDDSVKFGVDAINMSLGSTAGFSESAYKSMREVYNRVREAGIALYCAAGNEYSSTYQNTAGNDLPKGDRAGQRCGGVSFYLRSGSFGREHEQP